jgi:hypothetical protein
MAGCAAVLRRKENKERKAGKKSHIPKHTFLKKRKRQDD